MNGQGRRSDRDPDLPRYERRESPGETGHFSYESGPETRSVY